MLSCKTPDLMPGNISQCLSYRCLLPLRASLRRGLIQLGGNPSLRILTIDARSARAGSIRKTGHSIGGKQRPLATYRRPTCPPHVGTLAGLHSLRGCQHNPRPRHHSLLSPGRSNQTLRFTPFFHRQLGTCNSSTYIIAQNEHFRNCALHNNLDEPDSAHHDCQEERKPVPAFRRRGSRRNLVFARRPPRVRPSLWPAPRFTGCKALFRATESCTT